MNTSMKIGKTYFASRARAKTPAASGAAAEVPEWVRVHLPYRSVVAWSEKSTNKLDPTTESIHLQFLPEVTIFSGLATNSIFDKYAL